MPILEMGVWGIEDASKKYFGVSASQWPGSVCNSRRYAQGLRSITPLCSVECDQSPQYGPQNMVAAGYIDQKTADQSAAVDIHGPAGSMPMKASLEDYCYPSYFDAVINEVVTNMARPKKPLSKWLPAYTELIKITKQAWW